MPTLADMVEYDLTQMGTEIRAIFGIKTVTNAQRKKLDKIVTKYAKRQVETVLAHAYEEHRRGFSRQPRRFQN